MLTASGWLPGFAAAGGRIAICADLWLHQHPNPEQILLDGQALGGVVEQAAHWMNVPLAVPRMDLFLLQASMAYRMGLPPADQETLRFTEAPTPKQVAQILQKGVGQFTPRYQAQIGALRYIVGTGILIPTGMEIGPFSLATKITPTEDSIEAAAYAARGEDAEGGSALVRLEACLELATEAIVESVKAQIASGATAIVIAEPAANTTYLMARAIGTDHDPYERFVMRYLRRVRQAIVDGGAEFILHCCGELTPGMLTHFASLNATALSLGSPCSLELAAEHIPESTTILGNIPTKRFAVDRTLTPDSVAAHARTSTALIRVRRPNSFVRCSECDILGSEDPVLNQHMLDLVQAFLTR